MKSCEKTVIPATVIEKIVIDITRELKGLDSIEVESSLIGEMVATKLKHIDKVAYIRFASVFRRFVDVEDFEKEVKKLVRTDHAYET